MASVVGILCLCGAVILVCMVDVEKGELMDKRMEDDGGHSVLMAGPFSHFGHLSDIYFGHFQEFSVSVWL